MIPFVVFSLPRSRSAWLSHFLRKDRKVGHDIGLECDTPDDFLSMLSPGMLAGTCETGAMFAYSLLKREIPHIRILVIRRPASEVNASLEKIGVMGQADPMVEGERLLRVISTDPGVTTIKFSDLEKPAVLEWIYAHLTGESVDPAWLAQMRAFNIQIKMGDRIRRLQERAEQIASLKAQIHRRIAWVN